MGTEVLYPQDCFAHHRLKPSHAAFAPRRRTQQRPAILSGTFPFTQHAGNFPPSHHAGPSSRPCRRASVVAEGRRRQETSPRPSNRAGVAPARAGAITGGRVTILKRGESLDAKTSQSITRETRGKAFSTGGDPSVVLSSDGCGDLIVFSTERLGPEPAVLIKPVRLRSASADGYAGSAFSMSPSPRALPLPSFWRKSEAGGDAAGDEVDLSATQDLRRLLRLE